MLGCSRATVRVRLHRARRRFARLLGEEGHQLTTIPLPARRDGHERFSALTGAPDRTREAQ
jgi:hypothetical protein